MVVLLGGFVFADRLTAWSEAGIYGDEIVHAITTPYQRLIVTRWKDDLRLYINGNLQFSSRDEHRYHEALVHPMMESLPWARHVLILGGGDWPASKTPARGAALPERRARDAGRPRPSRHRSLQESSEPLVAC